MVDVDARPLTAKQARFVAEYLIDLNATQAAIRAGYSAKTANTVAAQNLAKPSISAAVAEAQKARSERTEITQDDVLRRLWQLSTADARELVEYRRTCCRHCWGEQYDYQFTEREWTRKVESERKAFENRKNKKATDVFDEGNIDAHGGLGFDARREPNTACPECFGAGVERPYLHDTRQLSQAAALLYAGVKQTKDGIEVKMLDRMTALVKVGEHLGMFKGGANVNVNVNLEELSDVQLEHLAKGGSLATLPR